MSFITTPASFKKSIPFFQSLSISVGIFSTLYSFGMPIVKSFTFSVRFELKSLTFIFTEVISWKRGICKGKGTAYTNGDIACEADMVITIPDILDQYLPQKKQNSECV